MKKIMIDQEFWALFPEAQINCLVVKNINNVADAAQETFFTNLLKSSKEQAKRYLTTDTFSENQVIQEWRSAFQQFKTKKGVRSSIEALLKRVNQEREFSPINPLVDIYNSISLKYGVPLGGEDLDTIVGDLHLGVAKGGESFFPLGADTDSPALESEVIYYDEKGAICRCLNWREAQRTMLTEETTRAVLFIESINETQRARANEAIKELSLLIQEYFNVTGDDYVLSKESPEIIL